MFWVIERGVLKYVYSLQNLPTKHTIHSKLTSFLLAYFRPLPCHTSRLQGHDLAKQGVSIFVTVTAFAQKCSDTQGAGAGAHARARAGAGARAEREAQILQTVKMSNKYVVKSCWWYGVSITVLYILMTNKAVSYQR